MQDPIARIRAEQLGHLGERRAVAGAAGLLLAQPAPRAGQRQPFHVEQMLQAQHTLDVDATIDAWAACGLGDAQIRKFRLPRAENERLDLGDLADLGLPEQRAVGNFHRVHCGHQSARKV